MIGKLEKTEGRRWLRLGIGASFLVTEATITADALKAELGATLSYANAIDTGNIILLPITPYIYANADNDLLIANRVMLGDSLSHMTLSPSQRIHAYWIDDFEQAMHAQVYFDNLLPAQISDTLDQLAIIKKADGSELKYLNTICGQTLTDRSLDSIVARSFKNSLSKATEEKIHTYREKFRETNRTSHVITKNQPERVSVNVETPISSLSDSIETAADSKTPKQHQPDHPSTPVIFSAKGIEEHFSWTRSKPISSAKANWERLGLESTFKLTLPLFLEELGYTHTPEQVAQGEKIIEAFPASHGSEPLTLALLLLDELNDQCGINTDTIKRRLTARGNT